MSARRPSYPVWPHLLLIFGGMVLDCAPLVILGMVLGATWLLVTCFDKDWS